MAAISFGNGNSNNESHHKSLSSEEVIKVGNLALVQKVGGQSGVAIDSSGDKKTDGKTVSVINKNQTNVSSLSPIEINSGAASAASLASATSVPALSLPVYVDYFRFIESGKKSVEGRLHRPLLEKLKIGDILRFTNTASPTEFLDVTITSLTHYATFREMLTNQGVQNCFPGLEDVEKGVKIYHSFPKYQEEEGIYGVLAIGIKRN